MLFAWSIRPQTKSTGCDPFDAVRMEAALAASLDGEFHKIPAHLKDYTADDPPPRLAQAQQVLRAIGEAFDKPLSIEDQNAERIDALRTAVQRFAAQARNIEPRTIMKAVALAHGLEVSDLHRGKQDMAHIRARHHAVMLVLALCPSLTLSNVGRLFGGMDHSSITHVIRAWGKKVEAIAAQAELANTALQVTPEQIETGLALRQQTRGIRSADAKVVR